MRRVLAALLALAATLVGAAPAASATQAELAAKLAAELRGAPGTSGAYVRDVDTGEELFARRENAPRIPASVEKLFTTSAALLRLGPTATLRTRAVAAADAIVAPGGSLRGDLVLVGGGDPFFGDAAAAQLAAKLRAAGIRRIEGAVVGDESAFDGQRSSCCAGYDPELGGVLSALAYDRGIFRGRARLDAARFAAARFAERLRAAGVRAERGSRAGIAPRQAETLAEVESPSVAALARLINTPSNNFAAEMLLKALGARVRDRGTRTTGADVVRDTLDDFGVRPRIIDGSGLSRRNRATPREVVRLLERMHNQDVARSFRESLAVTGLSGTVRRRMRGTAAARRCQVKSGTLRGVSALAGYCRTAGGRDVAFALMTNRANTFVAKERENRIVAAIARLRSAPAVRDPSPGGGVVPQP